MTRLRTLALTSGWLAVLGCNQPEAKPPQVSATSCADFAERVCAEASHVSPICKSLKKSLELWTPEACAVALENVSTTLQKVAEKRKPCIELTDKLCAELGPNSKACSTIQSSAKGYTGERCAAMLSRYSDVRDDLKREDVAAQPGPTPEQLNKLASSASLAFGPADAKVTAVWFFGLEDPYSARATATVQTIRQKYAGQVRFVLRQFPLPYHRNAHIAAQAALAAHAQGKFWQFYEKALDNQSQLGRDKLDGYAAEAGLNVAKFKKAMDERSHSAEVEADYNLGRSVGVERTPVLFLNGQRVSNPADTAAVEQAIEQALKSPS